MDELVKIGESAEQQDGPTLGSVLKTVGGVGLGTAAGTALGYLLTHGKINPLMRHPITEQKLKAVRIGLPILGAFGATVGSRYNKRIDDSLLNRKRSP